MSSKPFVSALSSGQTLLSAPLSALLTAAALAAALFGPVGALAHPAAATSANEVALSQTVSAPVAQQLLARGAAVWDVRSDAPVLLPGAVRLDAAAVRRWLQDGDVNALAQAASAAGLNLFGEVLVYGDAGDPLAQAVAARLPAISRGSVFWLVGGVTEWQAHGWATQSQPERRLAMPQRLQYLASRASANEAAQPAAAALRQSSDAPSSAAVLASQSGPTAIR